MSSPVPPLYLQIAKRIRETYIEGQQPGMRLPPERDLTRLCEVSSVTIRRALSELEQQNWIERRQGSGSYVLERPVNTRHIGLLLEADVSSANLSPFYLRFLQELRLQLMKAGYSSRPYLGHLRLSIEIGELTCRDFFEDLREDRIRALIVVHAMQDPSWTIDLKKRNIPFLAFFNQSISPGIEGTQRYRRATYSDYLSPPLPDTHLTAASQLTLRRLVEHGHRRIAYIGHNDHDRDRIPAIFLYRRIAESLGLETDEALFFDEVDGLKPGAARHIIRAMMQSPTPPDSIYLGCDTLLEEAIDELARLDPTHQVALIANTSDAFGHLHRPNFYRSRISIPTLATAMIEMLERCLEVSGSEIIPSMPAPAGVYRLCFFPRDGSPAIELSPHPNTMLVE